jgi:hypothetical protein
MEMEMTNWNTTEPPHDRPILVYGKPTDVEADGGAGVKWLHPGVHTAYWDEIDGAFCIKGASWLGPFIKPMCWMDEPAPPTLVVAPALTPEA